MLPLRLLLLLALAPAAIAAAVLLAGLGLSRRAAPAASAAAVALGFFGGAWVVSRPAWMPDDADGWLLHLGGVAALLAAASGSGALRGRAAAAWAALGCLAGYLILRPRIEIAWGTLEGALAVVGFGVALPVVTGALRAMTPRESGRLRLVAPVVAAVTSSALAVFGGTLKLGLLLGGAAATAGAAEAIAWLWPRAVAPRAVAAVLGALLWGTWLVVWAYADLGSVPASLLLAAAPAAWLTVRLVPASRASWRRPAAWLVFLLAVGAATGLEARAFLAPAEQTDSPSDYGYQ